MASLFNLYKIEDTDYVRTMGNYKKQTLEWQEEPDTFATWIDETDENPTAIALPARGGKVSFLYCLKLSDNRADLLGIRGFNTSEWVVVKPEELGMDLVPSNLTKKAQGWKPVSYTHLTLPTNREV